MSERNLEEEVIEYKARESAEAAKIELANLNAFIEDLGLHRMRD